MSHAPLSTVSIKTEPIPPAIMEEIETFEAEAKRMVSLKARIPLELREGSIQDQPSSCHEGPAQESGREWLVDAQSILPGQVLSQDAWLNRQPPLFHRSL